MNLKELEKIVSDTFSKTKCSHHGVEFLCADDEGKDLYEIWYGLDGVNYSITAEESFIKGYLQAVENILGREIKS